MNIDPSEIRVLVRSATRRTGAPLNDEDLEQDVTVRAMEAFRRQLEVRHPRAFLRKVVIDAVRDYWRRRRTTEALDANSDIHLAHVPRFEDDLDRRHQIELLRLAIAKLDARKRTIVNLFYLEERSVAQIAHEQKKSISAVKMELFRVRRLLAEIVEDLAKNKSR